jgi:hypothetical protein
MARTIGEIYDNIIADKDAQASLSALAPLSDNEQQLLNDIDSTSKVAVWRLWAYIVAAAIWAHELLWDIARADLQKVADRAIVGTAVWYQAQVFLFQLGDTLVYDAGTFRYGYAVFDAAKQIVKRCAVVERLDGLLQFKVAKESGGTLSALTGSEASALAGYLAKVRFAGTRFIITTGAGDILKINATVYYDAVVLDSVIRSNVEAAISGYVGNLPFNGEFLLSRLVDSIQAVDGVRDVLLGNVATRPNVSLPYSLIGRAHVPDFGYYRISTVTGETLSDTLNFIAQ